MHSLALMQGRVSHRRFTPRNHRFAYSIQQLWVDVEHFADIDAISPFWSSQKPNLVQLRRQDYLPSERELFAEVGYQIQQHCNQKFTGKAYLIASPRILGHCFNPVSFFACFSQDQLRFLVAEVHNTPWNERAVYVHEIVEDAADQQQAEFSKHFHVSPFMPMDLIYRWQYQIKADEFQIRMQLDDHDTKVFVASMSLRAQSLNRTRANLLPLRYGLSGIKVASAIYWQAIKMWFKRFPIYPHPDRSKRAS